MEESVFEQCPERDARLLPPFDLKRLRIRDLRGVDPLLREPDLFPVAFDSDPVAA
jgi:hypothetical protein